MPNFYYEAISADGKRVSGNMAAADKFELARMLKSQEKVLVQVKKEGEKKKIDISKINALLSRVKTQEKVVMAKNLAAMIDAGLSLSRATSILERQTKNPKLKKTLNSIHEAIQKGKTLADALEEFPNVFSTLFISMVRAGEESGTLAQSLRVTASQMEKAYKLKKKIRGALIYPAIIITAMITVGVLMLIFVVPTLTATFEELDVELPSSTKAIIAVSSFLTQHTLLTIILFVVIIAGIVMFFRTKKGKRTFDFFILRVPIIGPLVKKVNSARTTRTLSSLLSSGVDVVEALAITEDVLQNVYYKEVIQDAQKRIQKGTTLSAVLKESEDIYPILVPEMVEVGEETGKLSDMLLQVATFYETDVEDATKNLSTIIEPILMIVVGVVVGFFAISMISPTYSLLNSI